jgi:hypothetical protein
MLNCYLQDHPCVLQAGAHAKAKKKMLPAVGGPYRQLAAEGTSPHVRHATRCDNDDRQCIKKPVLVEPLEHCILFYNQQIAAGSKQTATALLGFHKVVQNLWAAL